MRFSLLSLLLFTAVAAIVCCVFFALPDGIDIAALFALTVSVFPTASIAGVVYGKGYARAFSIGCISSMGWIICIFPMWLLMNIAGDVQNSGDDGTVVKVIIAVVQLTMVVCGLVAVGIRWLCLRAAQRSSVATIARSAQSAISIDPRDKADLYAILEGRISGRAAVYETDTASPLS